MEDLKLVKANIPDQYLGFDLDNLSPDFVKENEKPLETVRKFVNKIDRNIKNGKGLWFWSTPGLGKSIITACVLKHALDKNYAAYFDRASHLVTLKFHALRDQESYELVNYIVRDVDILAIEEIEKVYLVRDDDEAMNNQLFYEFLSDVYDSKKALLLSSNKPRKEVVEKFPTFIRDRLRTLTSVVFTGKSERARLK
jgi:DNA replication protein DnaC